MWPFLLILAIVPLIFFWSDAVREVFPALSDWLPESVEDEAYLREGGNDGKAKDFSYASSLEDGASGNWYISHTEEGLVAWTVSGGGSYRLGVGCHPKGVATLEVTHESGNTLSSDLILNFEYGYLPLMRGMYVGPELVGSVAQFSNVYLQRASGEFVTNFNVESLVSEDVARQVQMNCTLSF